MPRKILFLILIFAAAVNLLGAFGPELGFDALWYHLTIPKLYLLAGKIYHVPGGLFYYSELPRLTEMLYLGAFNLLGKYAELGIHLISWGSGIGAAIITYKLARKLGLSTFYSLLSTCLFYVTPLVGWQSGSAYIDLFRTFFEILALYFVISKKNLLAGLTIGLAISTKTLALGSLIPLLILVKQRRLFLVSCFLVIIPWFLSAYLNTGYPFYPIGAGILDATHSLNLDLWNLPKLFGDFWRLWLSPQDPISPVYVIIFPFLVINLKTILKRPFILYTLYFILSSIVWYITPRTGGGRFILPYLPAFAILAAATISIQKDQIKKILIAAVLLVSTVNIMYRIFATTKTVPYLLGRETRVSYLCRHLDLQSTYFSCPGQVTKGTHNLYYYYAD